MIYVKGTAVCDRCSGRADADLHTGELNSIVDLPQGWRHVRVGYFRVRLFCGDCVKGIGKPFPPAP